MSGTVVRMSHAGDEWFCVVIIIHSFLARDDLFRVIIGQLWMG